MWHEFFALVREFPFGFFCLAIALIVTFQRVVEAFINRNKPEVDCERDCECDCDEEDEDEEEVVESGKEEDK